MPRRALLLLVPGLAGCITHWQAQQGPPALVVSRTTATEFRITRKDGTRVYVDRPQVQGDSLVGRLAPLQAWPDTSALIAIPLAQVHSIAEKEADVAASVALGTIISLGIIVLLYRLDE